MKQRKAKAFLCFILFFGVEKMSFSHSHKLVACMLIVSLAFSVASCGSESSAKNDSLSNVEVISDDSPWYNSEIVNVDIEVDSTRMVESLSYHLAGTDDQYICIFADGWYKVSNWNEIKSNSDYMFKNIILVDRNTKQVSKTIDLFSISGLLGYPESVMYTDGKIVVRASIWDEDTNDYYGKYFYIDPETEAIVNTQDYEYEMNQQAVNSFTVGEYRIETSYNPLVTPMTCSLKVLAPDGSITDIAISAPTTNYYEVPVILAINDTTVLVPVAITKGYAYFELDLTTCELTECDENDYEWLDLEQLLHAYSDTNGAVFFTTETGISKINLQSEESEEVFDYSWCGVNSLYFSDVEIVECSDDSIVLCGQYYSTNMFTSQFVKQCAIVVLTKADVNPHAGKQIMELYIADGQVDPTISDAIIQFNDTNTEYFIELSDRYDTYDYMDFSEINSQDDYDSEYINANASISEELAIDIMNGEGPDIIMNASELGQLNNDNCLVDLAPYIADIDQDIYFTNIIDGAKTGDKLYQLPICFTIEGIQTDPANAGATGVGFTTDEYELFLDGTLNGTDVIASGQAVYFTKLFNNMNDVFISEDKISISGPEFAELADFVKENVYENSESWDSMISDDVSLEEYYMGPNGKTAYYCCCPGISGYLVKRAQITNGTAILGIPSIDGRGPMFGTSISVAVSSNAVNTDACIEFVKILLSDDIQTELAFSDKFVLNREVFRSACSEAIDYFNTEEGSQNIFDYSQGTYVTITTAFTVNDIDNLENVVLSCSKINSNDAAIDAILIEEMPAYFLGQKDLEDVVRIIQDRAQTVLWERY